MLSTYHRRHCLEGGVSTFLSCVVTSFPSLFIVSDEILGRQLPGFVIPISVSLSLSQVQVCPLSAVPRHPLVSPATLTATLS